MRLHFIPIHVFRETPSVTFFDAGVPGSNGTDVVAHHGSATSPPDQEGSEQYYVHRHQVDNNLVLEGSRTFKDKVVVPVSYTHLTLPTTPYV